jgi:hypothetical protein
LHFEPAITPSLNRERVAVGVLGRVVRGNNTGTSPRRKQPTSSQMVLKATVRRSSPCSYSDLNHLALSVSSPEKAGVGGSIPSLATSFNDLQSAIPNFGCIWLHFRHTTALCPRRPTSIAERTRSASALLAAAPPARSAGRCPALSTPANDA